MNPERANKPCTNYANCHHFNLTEAQYEYSVKKYGEPYCFYCQRIGMTNLDGKETKWVEKRERITK